MRAGPAPLTLASLGRWASIAAAEDLHSNLPEKASGMVDHEMQRSELLMTKDVLGVEHTFYVRIAEEEPKHRWVFRVFRIPDPAPSEDFFEACIIGTAGESVYTYTLSAHAGWAENVGVPAALLSLVQRITHAEVTSPPLGSGVPLTVDELATWVELRDQGRATFDPEQRLFRFND